MKHIYLETSTILFPKIDCVYHLKSPSSPEETIVTFNGEQSEMWRSFDIFAGKYEDNNGTHKFVSYEVTLLFNEILPEVKATTSKLPIFGHYHKYNYLVHIDGLVIDITNMLHISIAWSTRNIKIPKGENAALQTDCEILASPVNVSVAQYPIVLNKNMPNAATLTTLYKQFLNFNNDNKLDYQYKNSESLCHIRADTTQILLHHYGIDSVKLFKRWEKNKWTEFHCNKNISWAYHCAIMVIDDNNNKLVWDPWVGLHKNLLPLSEWLLPKNEPTPNKLLITNKNTMICTRDIEDATVRPSHFSMFSHREFRAFQAVLGDAVPNDPEWPLSNKPKN